MKKSFAILILLLFAGMLGAQIIPLAHVPGNIRDSIVRKYPNLQNPVWAKVPGGYQASFNSSSNTRSCKVNYGEDGHWEKTQIIYFKIDSLKPSVRETLQSEFSGYETESVKRVMERGHATRNIVVLTQAGIRTKLELDDTGKILKQE